ncbi:homeobox protein NANOG-like isoform X2 [Stegostoma tigrinum]|uniref:homeobox protein NANOG-like isoform X2 n=1 Tax=Stegostoma tigrinum TaxID=3053191 RepID=UPI002870063D|nr:homeobox protein NANOG-like isoform X2 [Stegostoma tigrinum]
MRIEGKTGGEEADKSRSWGGGCRAGASLGSEYSSGQRNFAETSDMGFVVKEVTTRPSAVVASNTSSSEADTQDDLERLNARGDTWLRSVEERELTEESISRKYKGRTIFSAEQLRVLQKRFQLQRYLTASEQQELGNAIGLTSQQVKTWFQNRRMKVKRLLKEPTASPQINFLQAGLSQNNSVVYGKPMDNMKQQFTSYSLSHLVSSDKQWPSAGPVYPNLGKFQSTSACQLFHQERSYFTLFSARAEANETPSDILQSRHPSATL